MAEKRYYWLKLKENFFKQKSMKKLRKIAGGETYTIIYLKMLLASLQNEGKIYFDGLENSIEEETALELDEDPDNVKFTILFLEKCGLLQIEDNGKNIYMNSIQDMIGSETSAAARMRKSRDNHNRISQNRNNVTEQCNNVPDSYTNVQDSYTDVQDSYTDVQKSYTEIEKEIDKDTDKESDKDTEQDTDIHINKESNTDIKTKKKKEKKEITYYPNDEKLDVTFKDYINMRKEIKKPMTKKAIELAMSKLQELSDGDNDTAIQILEQSIMNSWIGLFELKVSLNKEDKTVNNPGNSKEKWAKQWDF